MSNTLHLTTKVHPIGFPPVAKTLPQAVKKIAEALKPEKIILFGSYAYGNPTPDSDVDLLVIMKTRKSAKECRLTISRLLMPRPFPVDIIVKKPKEIEYALKTNSVFTKEIYTKGIILYERR